MLNIIDKTFKDFILTDYGRLRVLENVSGVRPLALKDFLGEGYDPGYKLTHVCLGDRLIDTYDTSVTRMNHVVDTLPIKEENISKKNETFVIKVELVENKYDIREIGVYETIGARTHLFAYLSGINLKKAPANLSFKLILGISLEFTFKEFSHHEYNIKLADSEYAMSEDLGELYSSLSQAEVDLERCIQKNARLLGFNRPEVYYQQQRKIGECLSTFLALNRQSKIISNFQDASLTDFFLFPEVTKDHYSLKNLADPDSLMTVSDDIKKATSDHAELNKPLSIIYTGTINTMANCGTIIAKSDPHNDKCCFEFIISADDVGDPTSERYLRFSAYSYDIDLEQQMSAENADKFEPMLAGEYRIVYKLLRDTPMYKAIMGNEASFSFVFNGDAENPNFDFYINNTLINSEEKIAEGLTFVNNFNYLVPPSFEDHDDLIKCDPITLIDGEEAIKVSAHEPDEGYRLDEAEFIEISDEDFDYLKAFGVFDELVRGEDTVSNYDKDTSIMTVDEIQQAEVYPDFDFLRRQKIVGDISWRKYKARYDFYQNLYKNCTYRNYTEFRKTITNNGHNVVTPVYYTLNDVVPSALMTFSKELTKDEITFISNVYRG